VVVIVVVVIVVVDIVVLVIVVVLFKIRTKINQNYAESTNLTTTHSDLDTNTADDSHYGLVPRAKIGSHCKIVEY